VVTLEYDPHHAQVARGERRSGRGSAGMSIFGSARRWTVCPALVDEAPFDLVFIDADKVNNANYVRWALRLTHPVRC